MLGKKQKPTKVEITLTDGTNCEDFHHIIELMPGDNFIEKIQGFYVYREGRKIRHIEPRAGFTSVVDYFYQ